MGSQTASLSLFAPQGAAARARPSPSMLVRGERLGAYRLLFPVGAGGMAHVWAAVRSGDYGFERLFAIKVMREEIASVASCRQMFLAEAKLAARVRHTNVVEVIDLGEDAGTVYQVMPLVEGDSLARLVAEGQARTPPEPVPHRVAIRVMVDVLRGLHAAHELIGEGGVPLEIVHRDVSPQNILIGIDGVSKIADFGVAKAVGSVFEETDGARPKGKVTFMAPEQLGQEKVDRRSDVFSAGVVLWQLLAGDRLPSPAGSLLLARKEIPDLRVVDPSLPPSLARVAMRALHRFPRDRYPTADAMADALEDAARTCSVTSSTKDVGSWVTGLTSARLAKRRGDMAEAATWLSALSVDANRRVRRVSRRLGAAVIALMFALCGVAAGWAVTRSAHPIGSAIVAGAAVPASLAERPSPASAVPALSLPVVSAVAATAPPVPAVGAQAQTPAALGLVRGASRRRRRPVDAPAPRGSVPPPRAKFDNPYLP